MKHCLEIDLTRSLVNLEKIIDQKAGLEAAQEKLWSGKEDYTGWVSLPMHYDKNEVAKILQTAEKIRYQCEAFVVIGIGGSYLGARAAIEMMAHSFEERKKDNNKKEYPRIYFAGHNLSGTYHAELLEALKDKEVCICVISKSGTTMEPNLAFTILKEMLEKRYGKEEAGKRIYAITDQCKGILREEATREGYESFAVPDDIGGRYSVLTAVGLLPIAVAGIDIKEMLRGAAVGAAKLDQAKTTEGKMLMDNAWQYAATRKALMDMGKTVEVFEYYEPKLQSFVEWLKQLFGESEGKNGKGLFPTGLQFSTDLHSMGQFLQEGNQIFFETVLNVVSPEKNLKIPTAAGTLLAGKSMNLVNQAAVTAAMKAHHDTGIPIVKIDIPKLNPYYFGQMVYFFETSCALTAYLMGVNPFDQPGVESYKAWMNTCLNSQGIL